MLARREPRENLHASLAQIAHLGHELVLVIQRNNVVGPANADSVDQDVGYRPTPRLLEKIVLQMGTERVLVQLDDKGLWGDCVLFQEDALGALRIRAVALGEDDD